MPFLTSVGADEAGAWRHPRGPAALRNAELLFWSPAMQVCLRV
ncbi:hypothetical protein [Diaphorobacter ruginosibacter]